MVDVFGIHYVVVCDFDDDCISMTVYNMCILK